jgi:hypothetical protein
MPTHQICPNSLCVSKWPFVLPLLASFRVLVLAVHDAAGLEGTDMAGLLSGLVATLMQAGYHHTAAAGVDVLNLWSSVAAVNPLQFRLGMEQARDVVAASQALAEGFAVEVMRRHEAHQAQLSWAMDSTAGAAAAGTGTSPVPSIAEAEGMATAGVTAAPVPLGSVDAAPLPTDARHHHDLISHPAGKSAAESHMGGRNGSSDGRASGSSSSSSTAALPEGSAVLRSLKQDMEDGLISSKAASDLGVDCWWHTWDESLLHG